MKRFFSVLGLFTILFTLASCQKEQTTVLRATISHYQGDGKVYIENKVAYWHESDQIWINGTTSTGLGFLDDTHFEIVMPEGYTPTPNADLCAVYPASVVTGTLSSATTTVDDEDVTTYSIGITLPATQTYEVDEDGNQIVKAPMVAQTTFNQQGGADVTFHNVCSLLKVMVHPNVFVHTITVSQAAQAEGATTPLPSLNGTGTITFHQNSPTLQMTSSTSVQNQTIVLNVNASRADGIFYIVIPPYSNPTKLIVTVFDDPQTIIERGQAENHTLLGNRIAEVDCIEYQRGIFSVDANGTKVSFARGNLTGSTGNYSFTTEQYELGTVYEYSEEAISTYSEAMGDEWFILSAAQWQYLIDRTQTVGSTVKKLRYRVTLNNRHGLLLLPDNWYTFTPSDYHLEDIGRWGSIDEIWDALQRFGAVFLPAEGQQRNHYWTSTPDQVVVFGNGNGLPVGSDGEVAEVGVRSVDYDNAHIRHAHYVIQGSSSSTEED